MHKTAAPWEELREKYEAGGYTYMQLAKEYGVSVQSVGRHARKENWGSGCRNERRRRAESRDCLLEMTRALMRGAALIVLLGSALAVARAAWISGPSPIRGK